MTKAQHLFEKIAFSGINVFPEGKAEDYNAPSTYVKEKINTGLGALLGTAAGASIGAGLVAGGAGLARGGAELASLTTKKPELVKKILNSVPAVTQPKNLSDLAGPATLGALGGGALAGATGGVRSIRETDRAFGTPEGSEQGIPELTARALAAGVGLAGAGALGAKVLPILNKANISKADKAIDFITGAGSRIGEKFKRSIPSTNRVNQKLEATKKQNELGALAAAITGGVGADYAMRSSMSKAPVELDTN